MMRKLVVAVLVTVLAIGWTINKGYAGNKKNLVIEVNQINWLAGGLVSISTDIQIKEKGHNLHFEFMLYHDPSLIGKLAGFSSRGEFGINGYGAMIGYRRFNGKTGMDGWFYGGGPYFALLGSDSFYADKGEPLWLGFAVGGGYRYILWDYITFSFSGTVGLVYNKPKVEHTLPILPWGDFRLSVGVAF